MRRRFLVNLATVTLLAGVLTGAPLGAGTATAGLEHEPIVADLDGDGHPDRATLIRAADPCVVSVEPGDGSGGYGPAVPHQYQLPEYDEPGPCPDLGAALDLAGDGSVELVVGFSEPPNVEYGLVVLRDFQPVATLPGLWEADEIGTAHFNGDDLLDLYVHDYWGGFITLLNTPTGDLELGPMRLSRKDPSIDLADFNGNGAMDVAIAYVDDTFGRGVAVVLDDGSVVELLSGDAIDYHRWDVEVLDANGDGRLDLRTVASWDGTVTTFIGDGTGGFVIAPVAVDDTAWVRRFVPRVLRIRANDHASTDAELTIVTEPRYGHLISDPRRGLIYLRTAWHRTPDTFVYRLAENDQTDTAIVTLKVRR
jgi:hypothetical protein